MKAMKKALAVLMLLSVIMSFGATAALAAAYPATNPDGTIIVDNPVSGSTYVAYRIFDTIPDVAYDPTANPPTGNLATQKDAYTIEDSSPWLNNVLAYMSIPGGTALSKPDSTTPVVTGNGLTLTYIPNQTYYTVTADTSFSAPTFAAYLQKITYNDTTKTFITNMQDYQLTLSGNTATASNLPYGYYFVSNNTGKPSIANLTTAAKYITIKDKNSPFNKVQFHNNIEYDGDGTTSKDYPSVDVGDTIKFTYKNETIPDNTGFSYRMFRYKDIMSAGLTLDDTSIKVIIGNSALSLTPDKTKYTLQQLEAMCACGGSSTNTGTHTPVYDATSPSALYIPSDKPDCFFLFLNVYQDNSVNPAVQYTAGTPIEITYEATVNSTAAGMVEKNDVTRLSNNPDNSPCTKVEDSEIDYNTNIEILKYYNSGTTAAPTKTYLADAEFVLYKEDTSNKKWYYKWVPDTTGKTDGHVEWVDIDAIPTTAGGTTSKTLAKAIEDGDVTVSISDTNGLADDFKGLKDGNYYIQETKAPAGYNILKDPVAVTINSHTAAGASTTQIHNTILKINVDVENNPGQRLPETGGIGTTIFYIVGGILVFGAVVLLVSKKIFNTQENN